MRSFLRVWFWVLVVLTLAVALAVAGVVSNRVANRGQRPGRPANIVGDKAISFVQQKISKGIPLTAQEKVLFAEWNASHANRNSRPLDNHGGPDGFGYYYADNQGADTATYAWIELRDDPEATWLNAADFTSPDDGMTINPLEIGFNFPFYDQSYSQCHVGTNGDLQFVTVSTFEYTLCLPRTNSGPMLTAYSTDLHLQNGGIPSGDGVVGYKNFGTYWVLEYDSVGYWSCPGSSVKYETILYANGRIRFQYDHVASECNAIYPPNIGIQQDGLNGSSLVYACGASGIFPVDGLAIWFTLPDGIPDRATSLQGTVNGTDVTMTWLDPTHDTNGNPLTPDSILIYRGLPGQEQQIGHVGPGIQTFLALNQPQGNLNYSVRVKSGEWLSGFTSMAVVVGSPAYFSNFDTNDGGWVADNDVWAWGAPTNPDGPQAHSGANVWSTGLNADYPTSICGHLDLNIHQLVVSTDATLEFWYWYNIEQPWDGCHVSVSLDSGNTWQIVSPTDGYPSMTNGQWACGGEDSAWSRWSTDPQWQYAVIPLGQFVGEMPIIRFTFGSDEIISYAGYFFDDVSVWGLVPPPAGFPRPVTNLQGSSNGTTTVTMTWLDPTQDLNGNPLIPDSIKVYRDGIDSTHQIAHVGAGVQTIVLPGQPQGNVNYFVRAKAGQWISTPAAIPIVVGTPTFFNDFESDDGSLIADPAEGGWTWGMPTNPGGPTQAHSGNNVWAVGLNSDYALVECDDLDVNLGLDVISANASVQFWCWYSVEQTYDGVNFRASVDDGATWQVLRPSEHHYEYPMPTEWESCIGGDSAWSGFTDAWVHVTVPIGQFMGQTPIFRIKFASDNIVTDPGFFLDDMVIWGLRPPQGAPVSGTVVLNGGHGSVVQTLITANGLGIPTGHPATDGTYTIPGVQVGNRRLIAALAGYEPDTVRVTLDSSGFTGANFMLRRVAPPAPAGLTSVVQTVARKDSLHWTVSPDTTVDGYKVYRKLTTQQVYALRQTVFGRTTQWVKDTLEANGVYNWVVTAIDTNMLAPPWSESDYSVVVTDPFGHQPPINLTADGGFDNHIHLAWNDPSTEAQSLLAFDTRNPWGSLEQGLAVTGSSSTIRPVTKAQSSPKSGKIVSEQNRPSVAGARTGLGTGVPLVMSAGTSRASNRHDLGPLRTQNAVGPQSRSEGGASGSSHGRSGGALDEIRKYLVYMDNALIDSTAPSVNGYDVPNMAENIPHNFQVKARYDDDSLSAGSNIVNARCNMAPGIPGNVVATPVGQTQMRITWDDPTVNADGSPCIDLAGIRVYRDDQLITPAPVAPGVHQFSNTPPDPTVVYTWTVKAIDEIPNEGDGASVTGSVLSPWHGVDYEWVDITAQGTQIANCDNCYDGPHDIGFDFTFYGNTYTQVGVSSNGFVEFSGTDIWAWSCPPAVWTPNAVIYLMAEDLNPGPPFGHGQVLFYSDVANQRCVISWLDVPLYPSVGSCTMQIVLDHNNGVTLSYQNISDTQGIVGVENADGSDGISLWCNSTGDWQPANNTSVQFWGGPRQSVVGTVRHNGGSNPLLEGVWVRVGNDSVQTDVNGYYQVPVEPGTYTVRFHHPTHCDSVRTNIVVQPRVDYTLNASLRAPIQTHSVSSLTYVVHRNMILNQTFTLSDTGACPLHFQMADSVAWLASSPAIGDINPGDSQTITVTAQPGLLQPGEYETNLWIVCNSQGSPFPMHVDMQVLSVSALGGTLPTEFALRQNYPNPFNPTTLLPFDVPQQSRVDIVVYNVMGQGVARPVGGVYAAGRYQVSFAGDNLPSGVYLVKMTAGSFTSMGKMMLLK